MSNSNSSAGPKGKSCVTISAPMEPAAPVTRMRFPAYTALFLAKSMAMASLLSRSSIFIDFRAFPWAPPCTHWSTEGTVNTFTPRGLRKSKSSFLRPTDSFSEVSTTWATSFLATTAARPFMPYTGKPSMERPILAGSSSTKPST